MADSRSVARDLQLSELSLDDDEDSWSLASESDDEEEKKRAIANASTLGACVSSNIFQYAVGIVILGNTVVMWLQVDYPDWENWPIVEYAFLIFFVLEVSLRILVYGQGFFCDPKERPWNIFDFVIVLFGVIDIIVRLLDIRHSKVTELVTILRAVRVLRILRLLRVIKVFRALYCISIALASSMKSVFWITVMFSIVIVVSAIFTTTLIGKQTAVYDDPALVQQHFGTVPLSMTTLFQFVTLDDWSTVARVVMRTYPLMQVFFWGYIFLTSFTMVSVLTGMITQNTQRYIQEEDKKGEKKFQKFLEKAKKLFDHADQNGDRTISGEEFLSLFHEKKIHSALYIHGIDIDDDFEDGDELFSCMDHERNGEITLAEFRDGLQRMRGNAKAKDFFRISSMIRKAEEALDSLGVDHDHQADTAHVHRRLDHIMALATSLLRRMENMEEEFRKFSKSMPDDL